MKCLPARDVALGGDFVSFCLNCPGHVWFRTANERVFAFSELSDDKKVVSFKWNDVLRDYLNFCFSRQRESHSIDLIWFSFFWDGWQKGFQQFAHGTIRHTSVVPVLSWSIPPGDCETHPERQPRDAERAILERQPEWSNSTYSVGYRTFFSACLKW